MNEATSEPSTSTDGRAESMMPTASTWIRITGCSGVGTVASSEPSTSTRGVGPDSTTTAATSDISPRDQLSCRPMPSSELPGRTGKTLARVVSTWGAAATGSAGNSMVRTAPVRTAAWSAATSAPWLCPITPPMPLRPMPNGPGSGGSHDTDSTRSSE
jgi:hypothetical protein